MSEKKVIQSVLLIGTLLIATAPVSAMEQCQTNEVAKIMAFDGGSNEQFGWGTAISGDTAVIGACDDLGGGPGAAYVFRWNGSAWMQLAKLTASDGAGHAVFGFDVSIAGDTVVIGAYLSNNSIGSAYVFEKPASGWRNMTATGKLTASDGTSGDLFGSSVSVSNDTVLVGALFNDGHIGSAYAFEKPAGGWTSMTETAKLMAFDREAGDRFGESVAISGNTAVIGASGDDGNIGSVYVFVWNGGLWIEEAKLRTSDSDPWDIFGASVAVSNDTVLIGAYRDDNYAGSAYVFEKPASGWTNMTETSRLTASDREAGDFFGWVRLAISGDTAVVGSHGANGHRGSVHVYRKPQGGWVNMTETVKLEASDGAAGDDFGTHVAISGDTVLVGASYDSDNGYRAGSAYVFSVTCNQPPIITCSGSVVLWSPSHDLVDVSSAISADDPDGNPITLTIRAFSDESEVPETGDGTGRHAPDFKDESNGGRGLLVRSERRGAEDGRFYIIVVTADDGQGGITTAVCVAAVVPHNQDQQSLDDVLAQATTTAAAIQSAVDSGDSLPPVGHCEHGLASPLGPKQ